VSALTFAVQMVPSLRRRPQTVVRDDLPRAKMRHNADAAKARVTADI
jgi:hypothetical protein